MIPDELYRLLDYFDQSNINTMELEMAGFQLKLEKNNPSSISSSLSAAETFSPAAPHSKAEKQISTEKLKETEVTAPLVGIFYESSSPDSPVLAPVGSTVQKGQVLGLIESMKMFNEIVSPTDGIVKQILIPNETLVEFGTPLFTIEEVDYV